MSHFNLRELLLQHGPGSRRIYRAIAQACDGTTDPNEVKKWSRLLLQHVVSDSDFTSRRWAAVSLEHLINQRHDLATYLLANCAELLPQLGDSVLKSSKQLQLAGCRLIRRLAPRREEVRKCWRAERLRKRFPLGTTDSWSSQIVKLLADEVNVAAHTTNEHVQQLASFKLSHPDGVISRQPESALSVVIVGHDNITAIIYPGQLIKLATWVDVSFANIHSVAIKSENAALWYVVITLQYQNTSIYVNAAPETTDSLFLKLRTRTEAETLLSALKDRGLRQQLRVSRSEVIDPGIITDSSSELSNDVVETVVNAAKTVTDRRKAVAVKTPSAARIQQSKLPRSTSKFVTHQHGYAEMKGRNDASAQQQNVAKPIPKTPRAADRLKNYIKTPQVPHPAVKGRSIYDLGPEQTSARQKPLTSSHKSNRVQKAQPKAAIKQGSIKSNAKFKPLPLASAKKAANGPEQADPTPVRSSNNILHMREESDTQHHQRSAREPSHVLVESTLIPETLMVEETVEHPALSFPSPDAQGGNDGHLNIGNDDDFLFESNDVHLTDASHSHGAMRDQHLREDVLLPNGVDTHSVRDLSKGKAHHHPSPEHNPPEHSAIKTPKAGRRSARLAVKPHPAPMHKYQEERRKDPARKPGIVHWTSQGAANQGVDPLDMLHDIGNKLSTTPNLAKRSEKHSAKPTHESKLLLQEDEWHTGDVQEDCSQYGDVREDAMSAPTPQSELARYPTKQVKSANDLIHRLELDEPILDQEKAYSPRNQITKNAPNQHLETLPQPTLSSYSPRPSISITRQRDRSASSTSAQKYVSTIDVSPSALGPIPPSQLVNGLSTSDKTLLHALATPRAKNVSPGTVSFLDELRTIASAVCHQPISAPSIQSSESSEGNPEGTEALRETQDAEAVAWENSLPPQHRAILVTLYKISRRLVAHLIDSEDALTGIVDEYRRHCTEITENMRTKHLQQCKGLKQQADTTRRDHRKRYSQSLANLQSLESSYKGSNRRSRALRDMIGRLQGATVM